MNISGAQMIMDERKRHVQKKGYDALHDDGHDGAEIADAADVFLHAYLYQSSHSIIDGRTGKRSYKTPAAALYKDGVADDFPEWPWTNTPKISKDKIRNLVKAGSLIVAEIDRLIRQRGKDSK